MEPERFKHIIQKLILQMQKTPIQPFTVFMYMVQKQTSSMISYTIPILELTEPVLQEALSIQRTISTLEIPID